MKHLLWAALYYTGTLTKMAPNLIPVVTGGKFKFYFGKGKF
jgi:hypothetical protein